MVDLPTAEPSPALVSRLLEVASIVAGWYEVADGLRAADLDQEDPQLAWLTAAFDYGLIRRASQGNSISNVDLVAAAKRKRKQHH